MNHFPSQHDTDSGDSLDWLAFRYVADELSAEEREEFELRLTDDQPAREAVARAVEVLQAARFAMSEERSVRPAASRTSGRRRRRIHRLGWMSLGAAACLLVVLGLQQAGVLRVPGIQKADVVAGNGNDASSEGDEADDGHSEIGRTLAMAWTQSRHLFASSEQAGSPDAFADREDEGFAAQGDEAADAEEEVEAPNWMLAALAGMGEAGAPGAEALDESEAPVQQDGNPASPERQEG